LKGLDGSFLAHPEQAGDAAVEPIDERQVFVALGVLDFIDTDGVNLAQLPVLQTSGDDMFDGVATRPAGQEEHVRFGQ
jgi:hypothetical protein